MDFKSNGSLCHIMAAVYKFKTEQGWYVIHTLTPSLTHTLTHTHTHTHHPPTHSDECEKTRTSAVTHINLGFIHANLFLGGVLIFRIRHGLIAMWRCL